MKIFSLNPKKCEAEKSASCKQRNENCPECGQTDLRNGCFIGIDGDSVGRCFQDLKLNVVITGGNGSGKSRLYTLIEAKNQALNMIVTDDSETEAVSPDSVKIINFSCNDAPLQTIDKFPTYTISKAYEHLNKLDVTETALNSLLFIHGMARGYIDEVEGFDGFAKYVNELFFIEDGELMLKRDEKGNTVFFGRNMNGDELSPGQKYLLRMAVALYLSQEQTNLILLLDEPETHLHPNALLRFYDELRQRFKNSQIWVATHSIALIAHIEQKYETENSIFYFKNGKVRRLRSDSEPLVRGLVGGDANREAYLQFLVRPDTYAANKFAAECLISPDVKPGNSEKDEQAGMIIEKLREKTIIDYGAGQGRLIYGINEWLTEKNEKISEVVQEYRAFDIKKENGEDNEHKAECIRAMKLHELNEALYFDDLDTLMKLPPADYVFMVNVLHEIEPLLWSGICNNINRMLKEDGYLIIVEQRELTVGEKAYANGFMVLTEKSARKLFDDTIGVKYATKSIAFTVPKPLVVCDETKVMECLEQIKGEAIDIISEIRNTACDYGERYKLGLRLAFWEHQHVNAELNIEILKKEGQ